MEIFISFRTINFIKGMLITLCVLVPVLFAVIVIRGDYNNVRLRMSRLPVFSKLIREREQTKNVGRATSLSLIQPSFKYLAEYMKDPGEFDNLWERSEFKDLKLELLHNAFEAYLATSSAGVRRTANY